MNDIARNIRGNNRKYNPANDTMFSRAAYKGNTTGKDYDFLSGISFRGGDRNPEPDESGNIPFVGITETKRDQSPTLSLQENSITGVDTGVTTQPWNGGSGGLSSSDLAYINAELARYPSHFSNLDKARDNKLAWIDEDYKQGVNDLNKSWERAKLTHQTNEERRQNDRARMLNATDDEFLNQSNAYDRYFAMRGAGNSSSAQILAPTLVGRAATKQRDEIEDTNAQNAAAAATAYNQAEEDWKDSLAKLGRDRDNKKNESNAWYNEQKGKLTTQKAELERNKGNIGTFRNLVGEADRLTSEATRYGEVKNPLEVKNFAYKAPEVKDFRVDKIESNVTDPTNKDADNLYDRYFNNEDEKKKKQNQMLYNFAN